jgi:hypothetical protein
VGIVISKISHGWPSVIGDSDVLFLVKVNPHVKQVVVIEEGVVGW